MNSNSKINLDRLLRPRQIAMMGGEQVRRAIVQCDRLGYDGEIWPVNPHRDQIESRKCYPSLSELPGIPDAAFVAIPNQATVDAIEYLSSIGTGGAVCYASGFAEVGPEGKLLEDRLSDVSACMPLIGPNCYGLLNFQDGVALWPDEQGGTRCERGVAIISQSGNISINLTMQRRGVPMAFLISTGNMTGLKTHDYINAMLDNPNVTAIGLYLEQIPDAQALSEAAISAMKRNIPIVVLQSGYSKIGSEVTLTHSHSMSGDKKLSKAFFREFGLIQVDSIPQFLETLKFLSILKPTAERTIASISCSGGEAALTADLADEFDLEFPPLTANQTEKLDEVLGDRVVISNPLDYHTYIWGNQSAQKDCFQAIFEGSQAVNIKILDYPAPGICDTTEWERAVQAIIDAKKETEARVAVVATLHENFPTDVQQKLIENGIAPMFGLRECIQVISDSSDYAATRDRLDSIVALPKKTPKRSDSVTLSEFQAKQLMRKAGIDVIEGAKVNDLTEAIIIAHSIGFPVVAKASSAAIIHKSDEGGVVTDIESEESLRSVFEALSDIADEFLIEILAPEPVLELIVGIRDDPQFGQVMIIGQGGKLTELLDDTTILFSPFSHQQVRSALARLKLSELFHGYRGIQLDLHEVIDSLFAIAQFAAAQSNRIKELEINPLFVYPQEQGQKPLVIDAVVRQYE